MSHQTLGQYFKELRLSARRYPLMDRAAVEAMNDEALQALLAKRRWGKPSYSRRANAVASREAWIRYFLKVQQTQKPLGLAEIGRRSNLDTAAVWKIEHDRPILGETLRAALVEGMGLREDSAEVRRALALWTEARSGAKVGASLSGEIADVQQTASFNQFLQRAVPVLATLSARDYDAVLEALANPAVVEALPALNAVASAGKKPKLAVVKAKGR
jgi:hypothetical protein